MSYIQLQKTFQQENFPKWKYSPTHRMLKQNPWLTDLLTSWSGKLSNPTCPESGTVRQPSPWNTMKYLCHFHAKYTSLYKPLRPPKWNQLHSPSRDLLRSINHVSMLHSSLKQFQEAQIEHFICQTFEGSRDRTTLKCAKHVHKHSCWNEEGKTLVSSKNMQKLKSHLILKTKRILCAKQCINDTSYKPITIPFMWIGTHMQFPFTAAIIEISWKQ